MNRGNGFTLLEVLIATVIGGFIAVVAIGSLRTVIAAKEIVESDAGANDELRFATEMMHSDLANIYRDTDKGSIKLLGTIEETEFGFATSVTMRCLSSVKARFDQPEGDVYEVQYYLKKDEENSTLMRRICPIVGIEEEEESQGGMLSPIAENVIGFSVQYYDGENWLEFWDSAEDSFPKLVEVSMIAEPKEESKKENLRSKNFVMSFPRMVTMVEQNTNAENEAEDGR
jgi:general secretion pathway protein J